MNIVKITQLNTTTGTTLGPLLFDPLLFGPLLFDPLLFDPLLFDAHGLEQGLSSGSFVLVVAVAAVDNKQGFSCAGWSTVVCAARHNIMIGLRHPGLNERQQTAREKLRVAIAIHKIPGSVFFVFCLLLITHHNLEKKFYDITDTLFISIKSKSADITSYFIAVHHGSHQTNCSEINWWQGKKQNI